MFDIKWISVNPEVFDAALKKRGMEPQASSLIAIDDERRSVVTELNTVQEKRNAASKQIGQAKAQKDEARADALMAEVKGLRDRLADLEARERALTEKLREALSVIPNLPLEEVPEGADEAGNVPYKDNDTTRPAKPEFTFAPKEHYALGEAWGTMDFETAAKISGSRFVVLKGHLARLERALGQFMLDVQTLENGYLEVQPPLLVRDEAMYGTGQLPKFDGDFFFVAHGEGRLAMIPTAEVPLTNVVRESILAESELPLRMTALTPCFRSEAGSAGRDTRGMIRQHQFTKVEMVSVTTPEASRDELERMLGCAEDILKRLGLHYRVMTLCTGDMGFGAQKTYDIEVWLPGQNAYREISSVSLCGDFQARRMDARYRDAEGKPRYVHTLNGSGLAVGRTLVAVLENYQNADGSVTIPPVLRPYMKGVETIGG